MLMVSNDGNDGKDDTADDDCSLILPLQWRHNKRDGVSSHRRLDCLPNHLFGRKL